MKQELQDSLYEKYPSYFSNKDKGIQESCMAWGIDIGDGWYNIISNLCHEISQYESHVQNEKSSRYNKDYISVKFDQIKEKFGGLRIYHSGGDRFIDGLISMSEAISYCVCEVCGNKGNLNEKGWLSVKCEKCRNEER